MTFWAKAQTLPSPSSYSLWLIQRRGGGILQIRLRNVFLSAKIFLAQAVTIPYKNINSAFFPYSRYVSRILLPIRHCRKEEQEQVKAATAQDVWVKIVFCLQLASSPRNKALFLHFYPIETQNDFPQILLFFRPLSCYRFPAFLSRPNYVLGEILNKDIRFLSRTRGKGKGCVSNLEEILWRKKGVAWGDISFGKLVCFWPKKDWKGPSFGVIWISCILKRKGNGLITRFFGLDFRYCSFPVTQHFPTQVCTFSHSKINAK